MRKHSISFLVIMLAAGVFASTALAQGGMFTGTVKDDEGNLEGAKVIIENPDGIPPKFEQLTDDRGRFAMIGIASGDWTLIVEAEGHHPFAEIVPLLQGRNPPFDVVLERIKHPLEIALGESALEGLDPDAIQAEFEAGDSAYNNEQWEEAISNYRSVLAKLPMMNMLNLQIGGALSQLGRFEEALAAFEAAAADSSLNAQAKTEIARTRLAMGDFDGAGDALAAAVATDGATREDLYNLGELAFVRGDIDVAAGWYEKAAAADPNWGKALFKLALVALNKGDIEAAKGFFSQVVEKDPNSEEGAQARATLDALP